MNVNVFYIFFLKGCLPRGCRPSVVTHPALRLRYLAPTALFLACFLEALPVPAHSPAFKPFCSIYITPNAPQSPSSTAKNKSKLFKVMDNIQA